MHSPRSFIAPLALAQFICSFAGSNMNVMINDISHDLHTDVKGVQTTITLFLLIMAVLMIPCSKLTDRFGRKRCLIGGLILYGIGTVLSAIAPGLGILILGNSVFQGVGTAFLIPPVYILTTMAFTSLESRAKAFGVISGMGGIGAAAGPLIGGLITSGISWRAAFVFQAVIVGDDHRAEPAGRRSGGAGPDASLRRDRGDPVGRRHVLSGVRDPAGRRQQHAAGRLPGGRGRRSWPRSSSTSARESAAARSRCCRPTCFATAPRTSASSPRTSSGCLLMGVSFVVSVFLQTERHYSAIKTGVIFTAATVGVLVSSLAAERLAKRRLQKTLIAAGFATTVVGIGLLLGLVNAASSSAWAFAPGPAVDRSRARRDADPVGQPRAVRLPRGEAGRDLRAVAQHLQPRLVVRHRDRRHDPRLQPRLGQRDLRRGDDRPRRRGISVDLAVSILLPANPLPGADADLAPPAPASAALDAAV